MGGDGSGLTCGSRLALSMRPQFEVGDKVLLKVSPWKGVMRFGKKGKLAPRYVGPFEILKRIGPVAYRLRLPNELSEVGYKSIERDRLMVIEVMVAMDISLCSHFSDNGNDVACRDLEAAFEYPVAHGILSCYYMLCVACVCCCIVLRLLSEQEVSFTLCGYEPVCATIIREVFVKLLLDSFGKLSISMSPPIRRKYHNSVAFATGCKKIKKCRRGNRKIRIPIAMWPCRVEEKMTLKEVDGQTVEEIETKIIAKDGTITRVPGKFQGYETSKERK
ncbi:hypothetical protein Tco_0510835 [Tanacetum coccineum]